MNIVALVGFFASVFVAGAIGSVFPPGAWYATLAKPSWNPPSWLFGPVWTVLYVCIAIAGYRVWQARNLEPTKAKARTSALTIWAVQLVLNAAWSILFFGLKNPGLALIEICVMLLTIALFIKVARHVDRVGSRLFLPYAAWVAFAAFLNASLWSMNPG